jgi:hypothetical protein
MLYSKLTIIACDHNSFIAGEAMHLAGIAEQVSFPRNETLTLHLEELLYSEVQAEGPISLAQVETVPSSNSRCFTVHWEQLQNADPCSARLKIRCHQLPKAKPFTVELVEGPVVLPVPGTYCSLKSIDTGQQFLLNGKRYQKGSKLHLRRDPDAQCWPIRGSKLGAEAWILASSRVKAVSSIPTKR